MHVSFCVFMQSFVVPKKKSIIIVKMIPHLHCSNPYVAACLLYIIHSILYCSTNVKINHSVIPPQIIRFGGSNPTPSSVYGFPPVV